MIKKVALVIGHTKNSPGACNRNGICEFDFNEKLALFVHELLTEDRIKSKVVYRDSYVTLPEDINKLNPSLVIEFHCNAFNGDVSGTEMLYWHEKEKSRVFAELAQKEVTKVLLLRDRGIKALHELNERGGHLLYRTEAPCIIAESFFIDNKNDLVTGQKNLVRLSEAYYKAILKYFEKVES